MIVRAGGTISVMRWAGIGVLLASSALLATLPPLWALALATILVVAICAHDERTALRDEQAPVG